MYVGRHWREAALLADDAPDALRLDLEAPDFAVAAMAFVGRLTLRPRLVVRRPMDFFELALKGGPEFWRATRGHRVLDLRHLNAELLDVAACGYESRFDALHGTTHNAAIDAQILRRAWRLSRCGETTGCAA